MYSHLTGHMCVCMNVCVCVCVCVCVLPLKSTLSSFTVPTLRSDSSEPVLASNRLLITNANDENLLTSHDWAYSEGLPVIISLLIHTWSGCLLSGRLFSVAE